MKRMRPGSRKSIALRASRARGAYRFFTSWRQVLVLVVFITVIAVGVLSVALQPNQNVAKEAEEVASPSSLGFSTTPTNHISPTPSPIPVTKHSVPFTPQAPLAQWDNPVFQDGCEEASVLMTWNWLQGTEIGDATQAIQELSDYQLEHYGEFRDRSAADTAELFREYFEYEHVHVATDITAGDIRAELAAGNVVITPMDGRALRNPHFTPPGPERHMLVIHGYDETTDEFITNDPGTRHGHNYRYLSSVLENAIRDYPTGYHEPITEIRKVMIVIEPE